MQKLIYLLTLIILSDYPIQSVVEAKNSGFSIDLIHHDSPLSPFYNSSLTPSELMRKAALRSKARLDYFNAIGAEKAVKSTVYPNGGDYLMKLSFGSPPVSFLAIADTGSDLIWVKCSSCQDCFNPQGSSTYSQVSCSSNSCQFLPSRFRVCSNENNACMYNYRYGGGATEGVMSTDTITLDSTIGQAVAFPASVFGCSSSTEGDVTRAVGLVGLGGGKLSLISQLGAQIGHKFAYCLLPYSSSSTSTLKFGEDAVISGAGVVSTPLITNPDNPTFYYLTLEGISVGQSSTKTPQNQGNIIIDSGTTLTMLEPSFYSELEGIVKQAIGVQPAQSPSEPYRLCYAANSVPDFPDMVFHFDGADLRLTRINTFINLGNGFVCMSIVPGNSDLQIFGNLAHINFQVEYDLQAKKLSFAPADCTQK